METVTIIILSVLLLAREWQNARERRELLDRIMCRDYEEYKLLNKKPAAHRAYPATMTDEEMAFAARKEAENKKG